MSGGAMTAPPSRQVLELLARGDRELEQARTAGSPADVFVHAHFAAIRCAAAVLAQRVVSGRRRRSRSVWQELTSAAPELDGWAAFFAAGARVREQIDVGNDNAVGETEAAGWRAAAEDFDEHVRGLLLHDGRSVSPLVARAS